jgi:hypothetical protein
MSVSLRADSGGATGAIQLNGSDKLVLNADGTLSGTANPATGLRSQALATMQKFADEFNLLAGDNGYQKLPSGLIIQWGSVTSSASADLVVNYPIQFPTLQFALVATAYISGNSTRDTNVMVRRDAPGLSQFSVGTFLTATRISEAIFWMALGR